MLRIFRGSIVCKTSFSAVKTFKNLKGRRLETVRSQAHFTDSKLDDLGRLWRPPPPNRELGLLVFSQTGRASRAPRLFKNFIVRRLETVNSQARFTDSSLVARGRF